MKNKGNRVDRAPGAERLIALCRDCQDIFGPNVKVRTVAALAEVVRRGAEQQWCVAVELDVNEATVRHDFMRLGEVGREGRPGLRMVERFEHPITRRDTYRATEHGAKTVERLARHFADASEPLPKGT